MGLSPDFCLEFGVWGDHPSSMGAFLSWEPRLVSVLPRLALLHRPNFAVVDGWAEVGAWRSSWREVVFRIRFLASLNGGIVAYFNYLF